MVKFGKHKIFAFHAPPRGCCHAQMRVMRGCWDMLQPTGARSLFLEQNTIDHNDTRAYHSDTSEVLITNSDYVKCSA